MTTRNQPPGPPVRVEIENEWVWCGEQRLKLTPKTFAVLHYLIEHAGKLVTKDQLLHVVWPDTVVSEWALTSCLREIRKALKDSPRAPQYIETVHRRGVRFIGPVASGQLSVGSKEEENQKAKGKNQKAKIFPTQPPVLSLQHSVLVGRETDLAQLHSWLVKALSGDRQIVFVTGEPGIGKTTLVEAFLQSLESRVRNEKERQKAKIPEPQSSALSPCLHQILNLKSQILVPGLPAGNALSTLGQAKPTCRCWKHWGGCVVSPGMNGSPKCSTSMRPRGWCRCLHCSILQSWRCCSAKC